MGKEARVARTDPPYQLGAPGGELNDASADSVKRLMELPLLATSI